MAAALRKGQRRARKNCGGDQPGKVRRENVQRTEYLGNAREDYRLASDGMKFGGGEYKKADTTYPLPVVIQLDDGVLKAFRAAAPRENALPFVPARQYQLR